MNAPAEERRRQSEPSVISGTFVRQKSMRVTFVTEEQLPQAGPVRAVRRPAKVERLLALAHHIQRAIDQGLVRNRAAVARKLGLTEARVTQFMDLLYLAPDIQLWVLELEAVDGVEPICERPLVGVARYSKWTDQKNALREAASMKKCAQRRIPTL